MTKPIDWTKPLRVVGTHERIEAVRIESNGKIWVCAGRLPGGAQAILVTPEGRGWPQYETTPFAVENIPPEPRFVEAGWTVVKKHPGGYWTTHNPLTLYRDQWHLETGEYRHARVLIEEPD